MESDIKTALLTGGNGNLGRLVAAQLLERGVRVIKFDIPGTEPEQTHENETIVIGDMRNNELFTISRRYCRAARLLIIKRPGKSMRQVHFS